MIRRLYVTLAAILGSISFLGFALDVLRPEFGAAPGLVGVACLALTLMLMARLGFD